MAGQHAENGGADAVTASRSDAGFSAMGNGAAANQTVRAGGLAL